MRKEGESAARPANGSDPRPSRATVGRLSLYLRRLESLLREGTAKVSSGALGEALGVLSVPSEASQAVAEALVAAGVRGLLNFAPNVLRLPPWVSVVSVDLTVQLEQLAFLVQLGDGA